MSASWSSILCIAAVGLASCSESGPTGEGQVGSVRATIRSALTTIDYAGTGFFVTGPEIRQGIEHRFQLFSKGRGVSAGQTLGIYRFGAEVPSLGAYELAPVDPRNPNGFVAYYYTSDGDRSASYVSLSGTVTVNKSTPDRVEGTFSILGSQYCSTDPGGESWCVSPDQAAGNQQIEITGSFVADRRTDIIAVPD